MATATTARQKKPPTNIRNFLEDLSESLPEHREACKQTWDLFEKYYVKWKEEMDKAKKPKDDKKFDPVAKSIVNAVKKISKSSAGEQAIRISSIRNDLMELGNDLPLAQREMIHSAINTGLLASAAAATHS